MQTSPGSRDKLGLGMGAEFLTHGAYADSHIANTSIPTSYLAKSLLGTSPRRDPVSSTGSRVSSRAESETASEIVVQSEAMDLDGPAQDELVAAHPAGSPTAEVSEVKAPTATSSFLSSLRNAHDSLESPFSHPTDQSELSSVPTSVSSKATTPVDLDWSKDVIMSSNRPSPRRIPRRTFDVPPKSAIPTDLDEVTYAAQCIEAAEASRLDPFSLHQEEYQLLRQHITHAQVTTYLNIRNSILRLWIHNPRMPVTRKEAIGCAGARWFDVASVCFDWLVRRGYINFGCVEFPQASPIKAEEASRRKTIVVIGGGMSGLGCARQLEGLIKQFSDRFEEVGERPPNVVVLEGRSRVGGRVYSREFKTKPAVSLPGFAGQRCTGEMGGMIITGFERGNPINILVRGQLGLGYRALRPDTTIYDSSGRPVDYKRDQLVEKLYNDCLDRVSEYKHKTQPSKLIRGNHDLIEHARDSSSDGNRTISQSEEAAAALPHALPVAQQNVPAQVNRVPVSSDKVTGRVHTEPGTPASQKASEKAKAMGWTLRNNISADATIDLSSAVARPGATLGSVLDDAIVQYRDLVDLTAQDHRLINWHIANLEYSNATNLHNLSLPSWDIDAGNEWEGKHTMVVGGYQGVPRGLALSPTPLDIKTKSAVQKITYDADSASGQSTVVCEDGTSVDADFVVSTIPLGVLKQPGSVTFDPPLPQWKTDAIERIGFGVLNKVLLVYKEPFWDSSRNIFGVLRDASNRHSLTQSEYASQRGRFFQWFNVSDTTGLPCLVALMAGDAGFSTESEDNDRLIEEATTILRSVFGGKVPYPVEAVVTRWQSDKFARGSYSSAAPDMQPDDYKDMARPVGNLFFAGEHTIGTHPATVHGAYMSGLRAASEVIDCILGPIDVPSPLVLPKGSVSSSSSSLKRKEMDEHRNSERAHMDAHEMGAWNFISGKIGQRPVFPGKVPANAYLLYSKTIYDVAKKRCEEERAGRKKTGPNDVRVMTSKMWKALRPEERVPYEEQAQQLKEGHARSVEEFNEKSARWDRDYVTLRAEYEKMHPSTAAASTSSTTASTNGRSLSLEEDGGKHRRTSKMVDYAESDGSSDLDT